tara:strand:- start:3851 stop:4021 length:171 start_codon:yes stop_codon:yes gene_type:complete
MKIKRRARRKDNNNNLVEEPPTNNPLTRFYRPKQKWIGKSIKEGGHWVKIKPKTNN